MKLFASVIAIALLGTTSLVKFFEAPKDMLVGEPVAVLAVAAPEVIAPSNNYDMVEPGIIPGVSIGSLAAKADSAPQTDPIKEQNGLVHQTATTAAPVSKDVEKVEPAQGIQESVGAQITSQPQGAPQTEIAALPKPMPKDLPSIPVEVKPKGAVDVEAVIAPVEQISRPTPPNIDIALPVRAPKAPSSLIPSGTPPRNDAIGVVASESLRKSRQAARARKRAQERLAKQKAKQAAAKVRWQSSILGDDD